MSKSAGELTLESMNQAAWYNRWLLSWFSKYLKGEILEIGCGIGNFTKLLSGYGQVSALDVEKDYVLKTRELMGEKSMVGLGDIEKGKYFFGQKKFDVIVCLNVLEHINNDEMALKNIYRLLKPKGYLILLVPAHQFLYGQIDRAIDHFRRYDKKSLLKKIKKSELKVLKIRRLNILGAVGWFVSGKLMRNKTVGKGKVKLFNIFGRPLMFVEKIFEPPFGISLLLIARK